MNHVVNVNNARTVDPENVKFLAIQSGKVVHCELGDIISKLKTNDTSDEVKKCNTVIAELQKMIAALSERCEKLENALSGISTAAETVADEAEEVEENTKTKSSKKSKKASA